MAAVVLLVGAALAAPAKDIYVATGGAHSSPFGSLGAAATNVQAAIAVAVAGDTVLVNDGAYAVTAPVVVNDFTLRSLNGPEVTTLYRDAAYGSFRVLTVTNAGAFVTGFTVTNGAGDAAIATTEDAWAVDIRGGVVSNVVVTLNNCRGGTPTVRVGNGTLTSSVVSNNLRGELRLYANAIVTYTVITRNNENNNISGGVPVRLASDSALMDGCRITDNVQGENGRYSAGVGVVLNAGTLRNCIISRNAYTDSNSGYAQHAGGVYITGGRMENCTIAHNTNHINNTYGRGVNQAGGAITNCIIYGNAGSLTAGDLTTSGGTVAYTCCPDVTDGVNGNITDNPLFADTDNHLAVGSPCRDTGAVLGDVTTDVNGTARPLSGGTGGGLYHDMGAHEMDGVSGAFAVGYYGDPPFTGLNSLTMTFHPNGVGATTNVIWYGWDFDNDGTFETNGVGLPDVSYTFGPGQYTVVLRATNSDLNVSASTNVAYVSVVSSNLYVATNGTHTAPFDTWAKAATNIHAVVDVVVDGCTVHVGPGTFGTTRELLLGADVDLLGSGPGATILQRDAAYGSFGVLKLAHTNAFAAGLTVTNGSGGNGAGVWITGGLASNITVAGCGSPRAVYIENGRMTHSVITNGISYYSGVYLNANGIIEDSLVTDHDRSDGAAVRLQSSSARMDRCRVIGNHGTRYSQAFGVYLVNGTLRNTLVCGNWINDNWSYGTEPGGVFIQGGTMENCTITANTNYSGSAAGKGVKQTGGTIRNCIIYGNGGSLVAGDYTTTGGTIVHSLAPELATGAPNYNLNGNPLFNAADYGLGVGSPCVNAGTNQAWMDTAVDLAGTARKLSGVVDMGAYEQDAAALPFTVGFYGDAPRSGLNSLNVVFHASASGTVTWYDWDFDGDGDYEQSGSGLATVTNTFGLGSHTVVLRAINDMATVTAATNAGYVTVVGTDLYVATNGTHTVPFDTWAKAATNINSATDVALGGCTVHVGPGTFATAKQVDLSAGVRLEGSGRPSTILQYGAGNGVLKLGHTNAWVSALTVKGGSGGLASAIYMTGGVASNVAITGSAVIPAVAVSIQNGRMTASVVSNNTYGVAVGANGILEDTLLTNCVQYGGSAALVTVNHASALVNRCRVVNNYSPSGAGRYISAVGVFISAGTVRNTLVYGNHNDDVWTANNTDAGGVVISGGTLENCTVVANTNILTSNYGRGVHQTGGTVRNCIIYGNGGSTVSGNYAGSGGVIHYSLAPELTTGAPNNNLNGNPMFADLAARDFRLVRGSICVNAGTNANWTKLDTDLDGNPRIKAKTVDLGVYEAAPPGGMIVIVR